MRLLRNSPRAVVAAAACALVGVFPASALAQADLGIDLADSADPVTTGSEFSYVATVSNTGADAANGVTLESDLPNAVDLLSATPSQGTCDIQGSRRANCSLGTIGAGAAAQVQLRVRAQRDGQATATASVSSSPSDPYGENNSSTEQTLIQNPAAVTCGGKTATIVGTTASETLTGTNKADVIAGLDGDDEILGLDGNDIVCGGIGNDRIKLGSGTDRGKGGGGNDRVRGSSGDDVLSGNAGDDNLGGGIGDDTLRGGAGVDRCGGGPGQDTRRGCE